MITATQLARCCEISYSKPGERAVSWRHRATQELAEIQILPIGFIDFAGVQGFVAYHYRQRITCFRGTDSFAEAVLNLSARPVDSQLVPGTRTHRRFESQARIAIDRINELVNYYDGRADYFTGHSLGGALAGLLSLHVRLTKKHTMQAGTTSLVTFESPRIGTSDFADRLASEVPHARIQVAGDMVPLLPPWPYWHDCPPAYFDASGRSRPGATWMTRAWEHGKAAMSHLGVAGLAGVQHHSMRACRKLVEKEDEDGRLLLDWLDR